MDLPSDKARILRAYDMSKKWELVCSQEVVANATPAREYIEKLRAFGGGFNSDDAKTLKKQQKKLLDKDETSTSVLKHLEISLRTNSIDWVRDFLSDENSGLEVLVAYMFKAQSDADLRCGSAFAIAQIIHTFLEYQLSA